MYTEVAMSPRPGARVASLSECRHEVDAVLSSPAFRHAEQLSKLLDYVCDKALLGQAENLSEYTLAVDVFGKPEGFRENRDSSVRVDVHRLRKRLAAFYAKEGADHRIRIVISPGSYVPEFRVVDDSEEEFSAESPGAAAEVSRVAGSSAHQLKKYGVAALCALLIFAMAGAIAVVANRRNRATQPTATSDGTPSVPATNREVHILAGYSGSAWADAAGRLWQPDRYFKGGVSRRGPTGLRSMPPDHRLYESMREGDADAPEDRASFTYDIPLEPGTYELRLYFADPLRQTPLHDEEDNENVRRFTIHANGRALLEQFDAVSDAGFGDVDVRAFRDITPGSDGRLHLEFIPNPYRPFVNAIEVVPSHAGHTNAIRIAARLSPLTDAQGKTFEPDNYSIGGRLVEHAMPTEVAHPDEFLRVERYGNFSYAIPVPPGSYSVTLYFAETIFSKTAPPSMCRGEGCRVFDVTCNGEILLHDFDVFHSAGGAFHVISRSFRGLHPNGQGKLLLSFMPSVNYAEVNAIEVTDEKP